MLRAERSRPTTFAFDLLRTNVVLRSTLCFGYLLFVFVCEGSPELLLMLLTE